MRYIRVRWRHDHPDEPVELLSELDDLRMEVRKVEVFPDGSAGYAGPEGASDSTRLGVEPVPPIEEIALDPQFEPREIEAGEFELAWDAARHIGMSR